jgi:predicted RND superfamily exporter protein
MNQLCRFATSRPALSLLLALLLALPFLTQLPRVQTVDNVDYFTVEDDPDVVFYDSIKETFGDDEFFIIAFSSPDLFSAHTLRAIVDITDAMEALPEVREVQSLANVDFIHGAEDYFEVRPFLERIPDDDAGLKLLRKQALDNELYVGNLISAEGTTTAIVVFPRMPVTEDGGFRARLLKKTRAVLDGHGETIDRFNLAGWTVTNLSLSQYMKADVAVFIPVTYLFIALTIWLMFRNLRLTMAALANISICTGATMGLFPLLGITLNNVTTIVPPLVMALALTDTVHILSHLDRAVLERSRSAPMAMENVLRRVIVPSFLTSLTTAVGFMSLVVSDIPPIREFGLVASAGMVFEFLFSFLLLPPLLLWFKPERIFIEGERNSSLTALMSRLSAFVQAHPRSISAVSGLLFLGAVWAASGIRVETNLLEYFKRSSPIRQELEYVESRLSGVGSVDISLRAAETDAFRDPSKMAVIDRLQSYAETLPGVDRTVSFADFMKDMNMSFHDEDRNFFRIPESKEMVSQYLLLYDSDDIDEFITPAYDHARVLIRISDHSSAGQARIIASLRSFIDGMEHDGLEIRVTGRSVADVNTIDTLVRGQVESLSLAAVVITLIMFLGLRSVRIGALSLIPNMFPIALNFGIMGILGIPLNTSTALISVVALGIAVDDTIHYLTEYKRRRSENLTMPEALHRVTLEKGKGICSSTVILFISFSVLMLSKFVPTVSFGGLSAVIMLTAWIGDMIVLPAFMLSFGRKTTVNF